MLNIDYRLRINVSDVKTR